VPHQGKEIKTLATVFTAHSAKAKQSSSPTLLLHTLKAGTQTLDSLGRSAHLRPKQFEGLPSFVLPYGI